MLMERSLLIEDEACASVLVTSSPFSQNFLYERHLIFDDGWTLGQRGDHSWLSFVNSWLSTPRRNYRCNYVWCHDER